jgi:Fe(3+) dicitrate transport protein
MGVDSRASYGFDVAGMEHAAEVGVKLHQETMKNKRGRTANQYTNEIDTSFNQVGSYADGVREDDVRKADAITVFAQDAVAVTQKTTVTPGVRVEKYEQSREINSWNGNTTPKSNTTNNPEVIPGLGVTHTFAKEANLFAGVHKGFAPPRVQDAVTPNGDAVDLEAERSTNYEAGVRGTLEKAHYELTYFRLDFENQIISQSASIGAGNGSGQTNAGETLNQGIELSGDYHVTPNITLAGNYTYLATAEFTGSRYNSSGTQNVSGNRLTYAPEHLVNLGASYDTKNWGTGLGFSHVSEQFSDVENTVEGSANGLSGIIPSYNLWDVNAWYIVNKNAQLNLAIKNLTDEKYIASRAPGGINPGMGMNALASLRISF